ncbi:MAG: ATP-binding protein [Salibacteraceae bacterium]
MKNEVSGRVRETELLKAAINSNRPELIAVYGRRRVGKTYLIRNVYRNETVFELTGLHNGNMPDQLQNFHLALAQFDKNKSYENVPESWLEAFQRLEHFIDSNKSSKKKVVFIDELPWLATRKSKFMMAFEHFWNSYASNRNDLVVVVCGSAAAFMVNNIVRNKGGLHNRITRKIRLLPFTLCETNQYLDRLGIRYSKYDVLKLYMTIGGIPHYLNYLVKGDSVDQCIDKLCFEKDGPLRTEFKDVFASLYESPERHEAIIRALAKTRIGLTRAQIIDKSGVSSGQRLTKTLQELEESGFIEWYTAFGKKQHGAICRLNDEYCMFYLKFIENSSAKGASTWINKANGQSYTSWLGFSFELACLKHIPQIKTALGIAAVDSENYSWRGNDAQIDLLIDRADNVINVCEMKFSSAEFTISKSYAGELRNKLNAFRLASGTRKNIFLTLISTFGLKQNAHSLELVQKELKAEALFVF